MPSIFEYLKKNFFADVIVPRDPLEFPIAADSHFQGEFQEKVYVVCCFTLLNYVFWPVFKQKNIFSIFQGVWYLT